MGRSLKEQTLAALRLLRGRGFQTAVSVCLHRKNAHTLRETVRLLASLGVSSVKCGSMMEQAEMYGERGRGPAFRGIKRWGQFAYELRISAPFNGAFNITTCRS